MEICMIFFISQQAAWVWTFTSWRNCSPLSSSRFSWLTELWAWIVVEKPQKTRDDDSSVELNSSPVDCLTFGSEISGTNLSRFYRVCKVERVWIDFDFQHVFDWFPIEEKPRLWHTFTFHTYSSHSPTPLRLVWEQFFISKEAALSCSIGVVVVGGSRHARETGECPMCNTYDIERKFIQSKHSQYVAHWWLSFRKTINEGHERILNSAVIQTNLRAIKSGVHSDNNDELMARRRERRFTSHLNGKKSEMEFWH